MQFINRIHSKEELLSFRNQLGKVIEKHTGSPFGERKLNEATAHFLGLKDFNTAAGILNNEDMAHNTLKINSKSWYLLIRCLTSQNFIDTSGIQEDLDDLVYDFVGTGKHISNDINNQGWFAQITALLNENAYKEIENILVSNSNFSEMRIK